MHTDIDELLREVSSIGVKKIVLETDNLGMELTEEQHPAVVYHTGEERRVTLEEMKQMILTGEAEWISHDETYTEKRLRRAGVPGVDEHLEEVDGPSFVGRNYHRVADIQSVFLTE